MGQAGSLFKGAQILEFSAQGSVSYIGRLPYFLRCLLYVTIRSMSDHIDEPREPGLRVLLSAVPLAGAMLFVFAFFLVRSLSSAVHDTAPSSPEADARYQETYEVREGDTLFSILREVGLGADDAERAVDAISRLFNPRRLQPGRRLAVCYSASDVSFIEAIELEISTERTLRIEREGESGFRVSDIAVSLRIVEKAARGEIESSLYGAGLRAGMPLSVLMELIDLYSFDVDFQRDVRSGDSFAVVYERVEREDGAFVRHGEIIAAHLTLGDRTSALYRFTPQDGKTDYYDSRGATVRKTLLKTPIDGARLSSGYGYRTHPILGYSHLHRGLDFAAESGAPVKAAGDGVVTGLLYSEQYGNYLTIRHANGYSTLYAHLISFAGGVSAGRSVTQGQIVAFVGSTGLSTGPHLHYEVRRNTQPINPRTVVFPPSRKLAGEDLRLLEESIRLAERKLARVR